MKTKGLLFFSRKFPFVFLLIALFGLSPLSAQISDPVPAPIAKSDLQLILEDWVRLPASSGGGGGRARLSVMRALPDGRLFVNDQRGILYEIEKGSASVYFEIRNSLPDFIDQPGLGTGFHSFAFHPDFLTNGKLYTVHSERWNSGTPDFKGPVAPVNSSGQMSVVSEWTTTSPDASTFNGTRRELFRVYFPGTIHAAQEIAFNPNATSGDPDYGMLYILLGEGGGYLKGYWQNEQRLDSPMGTVFRIDPLGSDSANGQYGIPVDNPYAGTLDASILQEIYAIGFRNPHRINWDTAGSGRAYIGDIGEKQLEELNLLEPARDYGFPQREGTFLLDPTQPNENEFIYPLPSNDAEFGYTYPVAQYDHGEGRAIALGPVYRGSLAPALQGKVVFGDIVSGRVFIVEESVLVQNEQTTVEELRLSLNGISGDLTSFVGNSRADLRFGTDGAGELYVMTKTDGWIRKVVGSESAAGGFDNRIEDWMKVADFSGETGAPTFQFSNNNGFADYAADPFGSGDNLVLAMGGTGTNAEVALPAFPDALGGSLFFRFAIKDSGSRAILYGSESGGTSGAPILSSFDGSGTVTVRDGGTTETVTDELVPGAWYEAWIVFPGPDETYQLYLRGNNFTAPTLLRGGILPTTSIGTGIQAFLWRIMSSGSDQPVAYLDDIYVDPDGANLSSPVPGGWSLVADFEEADSLAEWSFGNTPGGLIADPPARNFSVEFENNGNAALRFFNESSTQTRSNAWVSLPSRVEVSEDVTLFLRARIEDTATNQVWGLVNVEDSNFLASAYDSFEVIGRWTDENALPELTVRDGTTYRLGFRPFLQDQWYQIWLVVRNGGQASGGQTFDVYVKEENSDGPPALVYLDADFRVARETPLRSFGLIANNGYVGKDGAVLYDDIFIADGLRLDAPVGIGYGLYPGRLSIKNIPWLGWVDDRAFPYFYSWELGWMFVDANNPEGAWHYIFDTGWIWLVPDAFPWVYSADESNWVVL